MTGRWPSSAQVSSGEFFLAPSSPDEFGCQPGALRNEYGGTLLEMAVVLPTFFLLLFGIFNLAIIFFGYSNATYACRAAARYASLHSSSSALPCNTACVQAMVIPMLYGVPSSQITVTTVYGSGNSVGSTVKVSITIVYPVGIPYSSLSQISVGSSAQRTIER